MFDDVANDQRKVVYQQRTGILGATDLSEAVAGMREDAVKAADRPVRAAPDRAGRLGSRPPGRGAAARLQHAHRCQGLGGSREPELEESTFRARAIAAVDAQYEQKVARIGEPLMRQIEREVVLRNLDQHWREHLAAMDYLRQGIHLRGYAQKDYRYEFKREAFELFSSMLDRVKHDSASVLCRVEVRDEAEVEREQAEQRETLMRALQAQHAEAQSVLQAPEPSPKPGPAGPAGPGRTIRWSRSCAASARSVATNPAPAAPARSSSSATDRCPRSRGSADLARGVPDAAPEVLIAQRPPGKWQAGRWEFPGGKIEPGESAEAAVRARAARGARRHRAGRAPAGRCSPRAIRTAASRSRCGWSRHLDGEPQGLDGQALRWVTLPRRLPTATCSRPTCRCWNRCDGHSGLDG